MVAFTSLFRATATALILSSTTSAMPARPREPQNGTTIAVQNWGQEWTFNIDHSKASRLRRPPQCKIPAIELSAEDLAALETETVPASRVQLMSPPHHTNTTSTTNSTNVDNYILHDRSVGPVRNTDISHPYDRIGRVEWTGGIYCSGSLVGPDLVLTARHCVPDNYEPIYFIPFGDNDSEKGVWSVSYTVPTTSETSYCQNIHDWAIVRLSDRIGDKLGFFSVNPAPPPHLIDRPALTSCGYPGNLDNGLNMYCHHGVSMMSYEPECGSGAEGDGIDKLGDVAGRPGLHADAQLAGGQSGSGLWFEQGNLQEEGEAEAERYIIGVASVIYEMHVDGVQEKKPMAIYAAGQPMVNAVFRERERERVSE